MTSPTWPKSSFLLPWVLMYLCELPLILRAWGFDDWDGGAIGWLLPLALYLAGGVITAAIAHLIAFIVRRIDDGWEAAHAVSWMAVGALTLGLPIHQVLFNSILERPLLGGVSALLGAALGFGLWWTLTQTRGLLIPVHRLAIVLLLGVALPSTVDDLSRTAVGGAKEQPNLLLVTIDTCRTDHMTPYGSVNNTTPYIAGLAKQGLQFNRAYTPIALTGPAHATLFTGLHPLELGVTDNLQSIPLAPLTMAESLRSSGYRTLGVPGNTMVRARLNLHQGFDRYPQNAGQHDWSTLQWEYLFPWRTGRILFDKQITFSQFKPDAAIQTDQALALIPERTGTQPWFCWVHYFDAHSPYERQPSATRTPKTTTDPTVLAELCSHQGQYDLSYNGLLPLFGAAELANREITPLIATEQEIEDVRTVYDSQLEYIDQQLERLCTTLQQRGQLDNTVIVITADHGEALFEHGYFGHSYYPYEGEHRIPLIVYSWKRTWSASIDEGLVSLQDIAVGLKDLGIPSAAARDWGSRGNPVGEMLTGNNSPPESRSPLLLIRGDHSRTLLTTDHNKLTYFATPGIAPRAVHPWPGPDWSWKRLYGGLNHLELTDLYPQALEHREERKELLTLQITLSDLVDSYEGVTLADVNYAGYAGTFDDDEHSILQSLGYLQGTSSASGSSNVVPTARYTPAAEAQAAQVATEAVPAQ